MSWSLSVVNDPAFYALAIPSALLIGLSKSGFASGIGSLAVPLMAMLVGVPQAVAILLPLLLVSDLMGLGALMRHADWRILRQTLPGGLLGGLFGWLSFGLLQASTVAAVVGAVTLLFLLLQWVRPPQPDSLPPGPLRTALCALTSGYTSFVAHAGGPPMVMALLPRRLDHLTYVGTLAVFFAVVNASKWVPYGLLGLLDLRNIATSVLLMPVAAAGVGIGVVLTRHISPQFFYRLVRLGMLLSGLKLLADGLR